MAVRGTPAKTHALRRRARGAAERLSRDANPGRRLRLALAAEQLDVFAAGQRIDVLDAGAEEGLLAMRLAARHPDWTVVAVDYSYPPLHRGRRWAMQAGLPVRFAQADLTRHFATEAFDAVVSLECLVEVPDEAAALQTMVDALRPGGLLVAQLPTHDWTPVLPGSARAWFREVRHGYDRAELRAWLESAGLTVRSVDPTFQRLTALAQDVRDAAKRRSVWLRAALAPVLILAVWLERHGVRIGPPRAWFIVATKR